MGWKPAGGSITGSAGEALAAGRWIPPRRRSGLAFCKKVVEEHGGAIYADRGELGGARFTLELPAVPARGKT